MTFLDTLNNQPKKGINKNLTKFLGLEFKSGKIIKPKAMKFIVKEILPDYRQQ